MIIIDICGSVHRHTNCEDVHSLLLLSFIMFLIGIMMQVIFTGTLVQFCLYVSEPKKKGKRKKKKKGGNVGGAGESQGSPEEGEPGMSVCHSCA